VRKQFSDGGERLRFTFPSLITQSLKLAQRYKALEEVVSRIVALMIAGIVRI
jgi:hypothetical protein